jgi:hypothetical protein
MFSVADRAELPGSLCTKSLTSQAGGNGFDVVMRRTITLFCITECFQDSSITDQKELLSPAYLMMTQTLGIPAAAGNPQYATHGFDGELSPMLFNKDILHFRRFAKYVAAFWRMASSSSRSANWRLRRAISTDISCSSSEEQRALLILLRHA